MRDSHNVSKIGLIFSALSKSACGRLVCPIRHFVQPWWWLYMMWLCWHKKSHSIEIWCIPHEYGFFHSIMQGLTLSIWFTWPLGTWFWKLMCPEKIFTCPSQYLYKPCKAYVYCWENKYMPWLKNHLPIWARNHKSLCPGRSTCPDHVGMP